MKQPLVVKKFGGTSVGTLERIETVAAQIIRAKQRGDQLVIVVSAMSGETDRLLNLAYSISPEPQPRELAALITTGEQVSMTLLAMALRQKGYLAKSYNASQLAVITDPAHLKARILSIDITKIRADLANDQIIIVAGFQGVSLQGEVTALGRGGSDISAVALACALGASECQIYTDVDGIYTADPRLVSRAMHLPSINFNVMLELANLGSKVLQWRSVALAGKYQIPLRVLSSFKEGCGTLINYNTSHPLESPQFVGISHQSGLMRLIMIIDQPKGDELAVISRQFVQQDINLEHLSQLVLNQQLQICLVVNREERVRVTEMLEQLAVAHHWEMQSVSGLARIALVGSGFRSYPWVTAQFLEILRGIKINIQEFIYSELSLAAIIDEKDLVQAVAALHQSFFE
jgi:aspartate kinase